VLVEAKPFCYVEDKSINRSQKKRASKRDTPHPDTWDFLSCNKLRLSGAEEDVKRWIALHLYDQRLDTKPPALQIPRLSVAKLHTGS
jgi:hypothetical protein